MDYHGQARGNPNVYSPSPLAELGASVELSASLASATSAEATKYHLKYFQAVVPHCLLRRSNFGYEDRATTAKAVVFVRRHRLWPTASAEADKKLKNVKFPLGFTPHIINYVRGSEDFGVLTREKKRYTNL